MSAWLANTLRSRLLLNRSVSWGANAVLGLAVIADEKAQPLVHELPAKGPVAGKHTTRGEGDTGFVQPEGRGPRKTAAVGVNQIGAPGSGATAVLESQTGRRLVAELALDAEFGGSGH